MATGEPTKLGTLHDIKEELTDIPEVDYTPRTMVYVRSELPYAPATRFRAGKVKEIIKDMLREKLGSVTYDSEQAPQWVREITDGVKNEIRDMGLERYKIVVQTVVGEQRDQGFQLSSRCLWDPNTDDYAHGSFVNDKIFGVVGAWAIYVT